MINVDYWHIVALWQYNEVCVKFFFHWHDLSIASHLFVNFICLMLSSYYMTEYGHGNVWFLCIIREILWKTHVWRRWWSCKSCFFFNLNGFSFCLAEPVKFVQLIGLIWRWRDGTGWCEERHNERNCTTVLNGAMCIHTHILNNDFEYNGWMDVILHIKSMERTHCTWKFFRRFFFEFRAKIPDLKRKCLGIGPRIISLERT